MRVALLIERLASSDECERSPLDMDRVLALAAEHDLVVSVDEDSESLSVVRDAGVPVHISDKRHLHLPGGAMIDADRALVGWLEAEHARRPFDLMVASPHRSPRVRDGSALVDVPWGVVVGSGATGMARSLGSDGEWMSEHGHDLWLAASNAASADVLVSGLTARAHRLGPALDGIPTRSLWPTPVPAAQERVDGELVVVVATGISAGEASSLFAEASRRMCLGPNTTVAVLLGGLEPTADKVAKAVLAGVPGSRRQQVALVPVRAGVQAGAIVETADALVLWDVTELEIPVVARRVDDIPVAFVREPTTDDYATRLVSVPSADPREHIGVVVWNGAEKTAEALTMLMEDQQLHAALLHTPAASSRVVRWLAHPRLASVDVVVAGRPRPPWVQPEIVQLDATAVVLHRRTWPAAVQLLSDGVVSVSDLIGELTDLPGMASHTLAVVPWSEAPDSVTSPGGQRVARLDHGPVQGTDVPRVGSAVRPARARRGRPKRRTPRGGHGDVRAWARTNRWPERARLARPWRMGLGEDVRSGVYSPEVTRWIKEHSVADRMRLVLPWKWGLLSRAMEGRW